MFSKKILGRNPLTLSPLPSLLDSPPKVAAVPAVPGDVAPPPARPLHLLLLHSRHHRGRSPAHLPLLLLGGGGLHRHLPLPDVVDLPGGRHPLWLPLASPVVLVHGLVGARVENPAGHLDFRLAAHLCSA